LALRVKHRTTSIDLTDGKVTIEEIEAFLRQNGGDEG